MARITANPAAASFPQQWEYYFSQGAAEAAHILARTDCILVTHALLNRADEMPPGLAISRGPFRERGLKSEIVVESLGKSGKESHRSIDVNTRFF